MRVGTALDAGMQQRVPELQIIGVDRRAGHFFAGIDARRALANRTCIMNDQIDHKCPPYGYDKIERSQPGLKQLHFGGCLHALDNALVAGTAA